MKSAMMLFTFFNIIVYFIDEFIKLFFLLLAHVQLWNVSHPDAERRRTNSLRISPEKTE